MNRHERLDASTARLNYMSTHGMHWTELPTFAARRKLWEMHLDRFGTRRKRQGKAVDALVVALAVVALVRFVAL